MTQDAKDLLTVRDFIRYAVSRFNQAELFYGHGTFDAVEEAVFLVAETLHLPFGPMDTWWEARLTATERKAVADIIDTRVTTRKPAAYLLKRTYLQGVPFYVDERVIVPRRAKPGTPRRAQMIFVNCSSSGRRRSAASGG